MNNEPCIKITPRRVTIAALFAAIFGAAALASPEVIRIGVCAFLVCCIVWNCYVLYKLYKPSTPQIDI